MKFSLEIESENAAFAEDHGFPEVARILQEVAHKVLNGNVRQTLRDLNGNTVGEYVMDVDEADEDETEEGEE